MLIDSHTHLLDERFDEDRAAVIASLAENGVGLVVENAYDMDTAIRAAALAQEHKMIFAAVGLHPHSASDWDTRAEKELRVILKEKKVVGVGEIGLDYHYDFSPREAQRNAFEAQLALAKELDMPAVIHSREATQDVLAILKNVGHKKVLLHCFSGSPQTAEILLGMGYYIAFGGAITFKGAKKPMESVKVVPMERMLIETDCPYMTPVPYRGKRNEPKYVRLTAEKIAEIKGLTFEQTERATTENALDFFEIGTVTDLGHDNL